MKVMVEDYVLEALDNLAEKYIPAGQHDLLHVNSREMWKEMMVLLIEKKSVPLKLSYLTRCAVSWEALLANRISTLN
jgi:hypothetical protein